VDDLSHKGVNSPLSPRWTLGVSFSPREHVDLITKYRTVMITYGCAYMTSQNAQLTTDSLLWPLRVACTHECHAHTSNCLVGRLFTLHSCSDQKHFYCKSYFRVPASWLSCCSTLLLGKANSLLAAGASSHLAECRDSTLNLYPHWSESVLAS